MLNPLRKVFQRPEQRPFHFFQIESSLLCNIRCVMCPWIEQRLASGGHMSWETFQSIAAHLHLAREVDLTGGGEPLCNPNLADMVRTVKKAGCKVGFSTNGSLLTRALAEELTSLGLDWISFSVDAAQADTYESIRRGASFEKVAANIAGLNQIKKESNHPTPKMMMVFVIMSGEIENYQQLPEYIRLAHSLGVEQVIAKNLDVILKDGDDQRKLFTHDGQAFQPLQYALDAAERIAKDFSIKFRRYSVHPNEQVVCEQDPIHNLFFSWDGYVSPCITLAYAENRYFNGSHIQVPSRRFGNINQQSLDVIWNDPGYAEFRQVYIERLQQHNRALMDSLLGGENTDVELPTAPQSCQSCYYLYGI